MAVGLIQFAKLFRAEGKLSHLLVELGGITYSAYLIHYPVNVVLRVVCKNEWIVFFLTMCSAIACAVIIEGTMDFIYKNRRSIKLT